MKKNQKSILIRRVLAACSIVALALAIHPARPAAAIASGSRYVATTGSDVLNNCSIYTAPCLTVSYAVERAVSNDTIYIAAGTYVGTHVTVDKSLTFWGAGKNATILDGDNGGIVFYLSTPAISVNIYDLTIQNGYSSYGGGIGQGDGSLTLARVKLTSNMSFNGFGGGIYNSSGNLTLIDTELTNNFASNGGGALFLQGAGQTYNLTNVTISDNSTLGGYGAGIHYQADNSGGGGLTMTNVTISGNHAMDGVGMSISNNGHVSIINSTIAGNHIMGGALGSIGGIYTSESVVTIKNSIIAGNDGNNCSTDADTNWTSAGNNISSDATCNFTSIPLHDRHDTNPMLRALGNYGGPNQTMALQPGSPAINGVTYNAPNGCPTTDERGAPRPIGAFCDIGAYEFGHMIYLPVVIH